MPRGNYSIYISGLWLNCLKVCFYVLNQKRLQQIYPNARHTSIKVKKSKQRNDMFESWVHTSYNINNDVYTCLCIRINRLIYDHNIVGKRKASIIEFIAVSITPELVFAITVVNVWTGM